MIISFLFQPLAFGYTIFVFSRFLTLNGNSLISNDDRIFRQPAYQPSYQQQAGAQQQAPGQQLQAQQPGGIPYQSPAQLAAQFSGLSIGGPQQQVAAAAAAAAAGMQQVGGPRGGGATAAAAAVLPQQLAAQTLHMPPPQGHFVTAGTRVVQAATSPTIKIRGLPYGSSPTEILAFFQTYHYLPDTLQIGLDQLGRPSGEAWLSFSSPQEALRAVRDLNRHYLGNRYLELSIC
ncbi:hypothetical protein Vretifemale_9703 [Volvox reticuliferus]|uniref:RRM domain-containing protein n=1 Tax=Volvox reticuliferus TaxID=1737510 RepID=A0A8J4CKR4_9CHLO|nr:hypothetical protein Vretifemale_9703 [Volvox reticuliferus]